MRWQCPACSTPIRQQLMAAGDETPRPGVVYRCEVCRLELGLAPEADHLIVVPLPTDVADDRPPRNAAPPRIDGLTPGANAPWSLVEAPFRARTTY